MAEEQNLETPPLVADDNVDNETVDDGDSALGVDGASDTTSLRSSILRYREENGRTYHAYKDGVYVFPNDEMENERQDIQHHLFTLTFDGKLHAASLTQPLRRALDAGTGTGIWAIDFADEHPECEVTGVDLSPIQPSAVPPNVSFFVDDLEDEWDYSTKFDFVFVRFLTGSIRDWPKFFNQSFEFLNPGGKIEIMDIIYPPQSDDGTLSEESALYRWATLLLRTFNTIGSPLDSALRYKEQLVAAGFVDVNVVKRRWPMNRWPKDPKYKQIGVWAHHNTMDALAAITLAVFTRPEGQGGLGWTNEEVEVFLIDVRKDIRDYTIHSYWPIWSVYATKPE
ncbi:S-adenosyl-L-methionine-dependent methyltransferase [Dactylonectria estremocensis]|uniref:S-adenosyl-L-methionine-dependent methyltransferase n=1 Tax=Dactylonectria estremocensis TaxID=1079267 RepID=A0A9P9JA39_9HYPO|nr:S-adenosyl-L-methionine-dependent methyltransferase [Dactylonectria estremocensis]